MATNTFVGTLEPVLRPRPRSAWTFRVPVLAQPNVPSYCPWMNGQLTMTGWIRDSTGVSQEREVLLKIYPSMETIARTLSDPANAGNNYFFNGLQLATDGTWYTLEVHNVNVTTAPRIKDNRIPI